MMLCLFFCFCVGSERKRMPGIGCLWFGHFFRKSYKPYIITKINKKVKHMQKVEKTLKPHLLNYNG